MKKVVYYISLISVVSLLASSSCSRSSGNLPDPNDTTAVLTFTNPVITGADPWVYQRGGTYYYTHTLGNRIALWKTDDMTKLSQVNPVTIFTPSAGAANSQNVWAPEIHYLDGKWYVYYAAGSGNDSTQRSWVLENSAEDPTTGTWVDKGRIFSANTDIWSIDGTVLTHNDVHYFVWSGRPVIGVQNQNLYISRMVNPWTLEDSATLLSQPELGWETNGPVNEGATALINPQGRVFLTYSASGCWTDDYAVGLLSLKEGGDPMNRADWVKSQQPVFQKNISGNAYGPGHNGFFRSPNGEEYWIIYHANSSSGDGCGTRRNVRMQKFTWNADGTPGFGVPVATGRRIEVPAYD